MRIETKYVYDMRTYRKTYQLICSKCNKKHRRVATDSCNTFADKEYINTLISDLNKRAEQLSKEPFTCNKCLVSGIKKDYVTENLWNSKAFDEFRTLNQKYIELDSLHNKEARTLSNHYKGRIIIVKGEEWVFNNIHIWNDEVYVNATKINKIRLYERTDTYKSFLIKEVLMTNHSLKDRIQLSGISR